MVAIGKPFGLESTMTAGIVSAKGRDLPQENLVPFIQTDAAVNPGNSGGPLFNLRGEVVGINSMIFSRTGGYMGLSFAIPIDLAMNSVAQLKEKGRVTRGRIGVQITEVSKETAESFGLPKASGALVNSVEKGGPADKAGVEAGDIVLKADGKEVRTSSELPRIVTMIKPGNKVTLTVWRKGTQKEIAVTVAEIKEDAPVDAGAQGRTGAEGEGQAQPARSRAVRSHGRAEEGARRQGRRADRGCHGLRARQRAARRRHSRDREPRPDDGSEECRSGQRPADEDGKGRLGDVPAAPRRAGVLRDAEDNNGE